METKEIKINVPEGYEIDQENSTLECIKFKPIKKGLPKTWEEFCETHPRKAGEAFFSICGTSQEISTSVGLSRNPKYDKTILPSRDLVEAMLALCQLIQLRDCYNGDWKPDWTDNHEDKHTISRCGNEFSEDTSWVITKILAFKTKELRDQFLENFRDLIEIAKPLL